MKRQLGISKRSGKSPTGTVLMLGGVSDVVMACALWFFLGQGSTVLTAFFALLGITGVGLIGYGFMQNMK